MIEDFVNNYIKKLQETLNALPNDKVKEIADIIHNAYKNNKKIFILGNGGSASTSSHFACDLSKGTLGRVYDENEKRYKVISLTDNVATITAYANDVSFDDVFRHQMNGLVEEGDIIIAMTGSGNSKNVLRAIEYANKCGAVTIGFLGFDGGKAKVILKHSIVVPSNHYGRIEDMHLILEHMICAYLKDIKDK